MNIGFFCEYGTTPEIGTGHYFRSKWISEELCRRGHNAFIMSDENLDGFDVLVIDDLRTQRNLLEAAHGKVKIVLMDGVAEDVSMANLSISPCYNPSAQYRGVEYMAFLPRGDRKYEEGIPDNVFVSMGGFDANYLAPMVLGITKSLGFHNILTKSINHGDTNYIDTEIYRGDDYYAPMSRCRIAITAGGLTMFQALHFGIPTIVVPQYEHQKYYVQMVKRGCRLTTGKRDDIKNLAWHLMSSPGTRAELSKNAQILVDGKGIERVCDLIEGV